MGKRSRTLVRGAPEGRRKFGSWPIIYVARFAGSCSDLDPIPTAGAVGYRYVRPLGGLGVFHAEGVKFNSQGNAPGEVGPVPEAIAVSPKAFPTWPGTLSPATKVSRATHVEIAIASDTFSMLQREIAFATNAIAIGPDKTAIGAIAITLMAVRVTIGAEPSDFAQ